MIKVLIIAFFAVFASARHFRFGDTNPLTLFLTGFNDQLNITNAEDLDKCVSVPLLRDINKTLHDLNKTKPNYVELAADVLALYADFQAMKKSCPIVVSGYQVYFQDFTNSTKTNPRKTFTTVVTNVAGEATKFQQTISAAQKDFENGNYYSSGREVAIATGIALKGYIAV